MDIRRVQMTGGSSYVLTLPKDWIHSLQIKKNDPLGIIIQNDGDLIITGNITGDIAQRRKVIEIEPGIDPESFFRNLIGIYIAGYNYIDIRSKDRIQSILRRKIRDFSDQVIGLELVEEEDTRIVLRDLLNPLEMPFENSIKRMYVITRGMHADSVEALVSRDALMAQEIVHRDRDVDRLFWLVARQTNIILQGPRHSERMNTPLAHVMHFFQTARIIERIADHSVLIATSIQQLDMAQVTELTTSAIKVASQEALNTFDKSITTLFSHDLKQANRIIESVHHSEDTIHQINTEILLLPTLTALYVRKISDSIRRITEYSADIAELVINYGTNKIEQEQELT